jgi:predicted nucleic acid-binding protein
MIVVADTSPLNYLILIEQINVLESIYGEVVIPPAVQDEMLSPSAPAPVKAWIENPPRWLEVRTPGRIKPPLDPNLGAGEREAIALAYSSAPAAVLLVDERLGRQEAERLGLKVAGTLAILRQAHERGLLDFQAAVQHLLATNFKASDALLKQFSHLL